MNFSFTILKVLRKGWVSPFFKKLCLPSAEILCMVKALNWFIEWTRICSNKDQDSQLLIMLMKPLDTAVKTIDEDWNQ